MAILREMAGALGTGFTAMLARPRHALLTAAGFLVAALILVVLLTVPAGMTALAGKTGLPDVALVLSSRGIVEEISSRIPPETAALIATLPGVAHDAQGRALVAPEFLANVKLRQRNGGVATVLVRGVSPEFWKIAGPAVRITSGSQFKSGVNQLIAGDAAAQRFVALTPGATTRIRNAPWLVTGTFSAGGAIWDSELWTDIGALEAAYNAPGQVSALWVKLTSPAAFKAFDAAMKADPRLQKVTAYRQQAYYAGKIGFLTHFANVAIIGVAIVLGLGALLAVFNALGMALAARRRETAVLRAVGFRRAAIALALLTEVLAIALACALIAILVGWLAVNGHNVNSSTFGQAIRFPLQVTPKVVVAVIVYTLILGFLAALWPIARAVRAPLTKALQDE